jgi:hypothetical protein
MWARRLPASCSLNTVTYYRLMKKISETVHSVHYERKVFLVLWICSRKWNHNWRARKTEGGLEKQSTFGGVTEGRILWLFLLVCFIITRFHSHRLFPGRLCMYFNVFVFLDLVYVFCISGSCLKTYGLKYSTETLIILQVFVFWFWNLTCHEIKNVFEMVRRNIL